MTRRRILMLLSLALMFIGLLSYSASTGRADDANSWTRARSMPSRPPNLAASSAAQQAGQTLRVIVDGAANPELIPEAYAYRHLLAATASSENMSSDQLDFVLARIARIGFAEADREGYEATLRDLHVRDELDRLGEERRALTAGPAAPLVIEADRLRSIKSEEERLVSRARQEVMRALSPQGKADLDAHVRLVVKRQMKLLGGVDMRDGGH